MLRQSNKLAKVITSTRSIIVNNKYKSLSSSFRDSFTRAITKTTLVDQAFEKTSAYKGEFNEYARPFDRYLEESRFKED
jgi:cytochrome c peroxidase